MQTKTLVFIALGLIWYYSKKVQAANALMVRYLLPQNIRISNGAVMWHQPVVITNPTGTPISLQRYNIQIQLENYPIGTAFGTIASTIQAGMDSTIIANVVVPLDALISVIPDLLKAGTSLDFRMTGNIFAELLAIPINTIIKVPIPKLFK